MKLDKAIEILITHQCDMPRNQVPDLIDAINLGIEALKDLINIRQTFLLIDFGKLPSETEE